LISSDLKTMQSIEVLRDFDEKTFTEIMGVIKAAYADGMDAGDESYIRGKLENEKNINVIFRHGDRVVGYLMATPHNDAYEELKDDDPLLVEDAERYYVNFVQILPEYRKGRGLLKMVGKMFDEAREQFGSNKFSWHCRTVNGLSSVIQRFFKGMPRTVRHIESWKYTKNEPYDYIEATHYKRAGKV